MVSEVEYIKISYILIIPIKIFLNLNFKANTIGELKKSNKPNTYTIYFRIKYYLYKI